MEQQPAAPIETAAAFQANFGVSRETLEKLETYASLLKQWQKAVQLVAPSTLPHIWWRHFADSAQLAACAPPGAASWLDIGSGGGFPGLVIAALIQADRPLRITLVESDTRKSAFLREAVRQMGLTVDISATRIESTSTHDKVGKVDVISARALAPLDRLLTLAAPYAHSQTVGLFLKGRDVASEIEAARASWRFELELKPSLTDPDARIARVRILNRQEG